MHNPTGQLTGKEHQGLYITSFNTSAIQLHCFQGTNYSPFTRMHYTCQRAVAPGQRGT